MSRPWHDHIPLDFEHRWGTSVDLGCGRFPRNPLRAAKVVGIDILEDAPFLASESLEYAQALPGNPLPLLSETVDVCTAFDVLEHLPRVDRDQDGRLRNPFIETMNEVHRILKVGGIFIAVTPCFPRPAAFVDPTHVNTITTGTHDYFAGPCHARALEYGYTGSFDIVATGWIAATGPIWDYDEAVVKSPEQAQVIEREGAGDARPTTATRAWRRVRRTVLGLRRTHPDHYLWVFKKPA